MSLSSPLTPQSLTDMDYLILTNTAAAQIEQINAAQGGVRSAVWKKDKQGRKLLPAALLGDCQDGQTWQDYREVLESLETVTLTHADFPTEDEA